MNINKKIAIILLLIGLLVVVGLKILTALIKSKDTLPAGSLPVPSLPPVANQLKLQYNYQGALSNETKHIGVYRVQPLPELTTDKAKEIAQDFGFTTEPQELPDISGTVYLFNKNQESILIYPKPLRIEYMQPQSSSLKRLSKEEITEAANQFIHNSLFPEKFVLTQASFTPIATNKANEGFTPAPFETARYILIKYNLNIDSFPVIAKDRQTYPVEIMIRPDGNIFKATITFIPDNVETAGEVTLAKPMDALQAINAGGGIISSLDNPNQVYTSIDPRTVEDATLDNLEVVYLYDNDSSTLQPYYRFSGFAETTMKERINVEVLITALPQEFYQK